MPGFDPHEFRWAAETRSLIKMLPQRWANARLYRSIAEFAAALPGFSVEYRQRCSPALGGHTTLCASPASVTCLGIAPSRWCGSCFRAVAGSALSIGAGALATVCTGLLSR